MHSLWIKKEHGKIDINVPERSVSVVENTVSSSKPVAYGVPLGSVLGRRLFLIYINDLPKVCVNSKVTIYADDYSLVSTKKMQKDTKANDLEMLKRG